MMRSLLPISLKIVLLIAFFLTISSTKYYAQVTISSEDVIVNSVNNNSENDIILVPALGYTGPGGVGDTLGSGGLSLWLDANKINQIDESSIATWTDLSGYANNAIGLAGNQPIFRAGILNNYPVVRFIKGNADYLRVADDVSLKPDNISVFVVGAHTGNSSSNSPFIIKTGSFDWSNGYGIVMESTSAGHRVFINDWLTNYVVSTHPSGTFEIMTLIYDNINVSLFDDENFEGKDNYTANIVNSANYLYLGITPDGSGNDPSPEVTNSLDGDIAEVIIIQQDVNGAQRIIIHNYLAAKYGISLGVNDVFDEDEVGNGDYDHEVAGIGRIDGSNEHSDAQGSGRVRILNPTDLDDDEFMMWGHNNGLVRAIDTSDVPAPVLARLARTWRVSEVNTAGTTIDVGSVDMRFSLKNLGPITESDLRLMIDTDNDGIFADETAIGGAIDLGGDVYEWPGVSDLANNTRFTLGTISPFITPLPVEYFSFDAIKNENKIDLKWVTASEINNDYFTLERSVNVNSWVEINTIEGAGNSEYEIEYIEYDFDPITGISYYRLKQTNFDGDFTYSDIVSVRFDLNTSFDILILYPNPILVGETLKIGLKSNFESNFLVTLRDMMGREFYSKVVFNMVDGSLIALPIERDIPSGIYFVTVTSENERHSQKLIINSTIK